MNLKSKVEVPKFQGESNIIAFPQHRVRVQKRIGQGESLANTGAFSYVYSALDQSGTKFSVKHVSIHDERFQSLVNSEILALEKLKDCPYIVKYYDTVNHVKTRLILLEFCPVSVFEYLSNRFPTAFDDAETIRLLGQLTSAVAYMHNMNPPLMNRDLKIDNVMLSETCHVRLCDFGSTTTEIIDPSQLDFKQKLILEEKIQEQTTPSYRAPEMLDFYLNYKIDTFADVWALGCIYYFVCHFAYPFENASNIAILNLNYKKIKIKSTFLEGYISPMIATRPRSQDLINEFELIGQTLQISIYDSVLNPNYLREKRSHHHSSNQVFVNVKSKAESLFESLKETGMKIKAQMNAPNLRIRDFIQCKFISNHLGYYSISFSNSRIVEGVADYLFDRFGSNFFLFELSNSTNYPISIFKNQVSTFSLIDSCALDFNQLNKLCSRAFKFLSFESDKIVIFHDENGGYLSMFVICLLIIQIPTLPNFKAVFESFLIEKGKINISPLHPSFIRYGQYFQAFANNPGSRLTEEPLHITCILISPVILCNHMKNGCRPFITISLNGNLVFSSLSKPSILREFIETDQVIKIPIGITGYGDVEITLYHMSVLNGNYYQKRIFSINFNTRFFQKSPLCFQGHELNTFSAPLFSALLKTRVELQILGRVESEFTSNTSSVSYQNISPDLLFSNYKDFEAFRQKFTSFAPPDITEVRIETLLQHQSSYTSQNQPLQEESIRPKQVYEASSESTKSKASPDTANFQHQNDFMDLFFPKKEPLLSFETCDDDAKKKPQDYSLIDDLFDLNISSHSSPLFSTSKKDMDDLKDLFSQPILDSFDNSFQTPTSPSSEKLLFNKNPFAEKSSFKYEETKKNVQNKPSKFTETQTQPKKSYPSGIPTSNPDLLFGDLLSEHGFLGHSRQKAQSQTLEEARKRQHELQASDPVSKKINEWTTGKNKNIRELLCSLQLVIWCPEKWKIISINQLNDYNSIKKAYRSACLLVHPDKQINSPNEPLARAIFCVLKEAWEFFESTGFRVFP